jgi:hypothetical protein
VGPSKSWGPACTRKVAKSRRLVLGWVTALLVVRRFLIPCENETPPVITSDRNAVTYPANHNFGRDVIIVRIHCQTVGIRLLQLLDGQDCVLLCLIHFGFETASRTAPNDHQSEPRDIKATCIDITAASSQNDPANLKTTHPRTTWAEHSERSHDLHLQT